MPQFDQRREQSGEHDHGQRLQALALTLFDSTTEVHRLPAKTQRLLQLATVFYRRGRISIVRNCAQRRPGRKVRTGACGGERTYNIGPSNLLVGAVLLDTKRHRLHERIVEIHLDLVGANWPGLRVRQGKVGHSTCRHDRLVDFLIFVLPAAGVDRGPDRLQLGIVGGIAKRDNTMHRIRRLERGGGINGGAIRKAARHRDLRDMGAAGAKFTACCHDGEQPQEDTQD